MPLRTVPSGQALTLVFSAARDGAALAPAAARARLLGPLGTLVDWFPLSLSAPPGPSEPPFYQVELPPSAHAIATTVAGVAQADAPATREARVLEVEIDAGAAGLQRFTEEYLVVAADQDELRLMVNSFQSYVQAVTTASLLPASPGWDAAEPDARVRALAGAYDDLCHTAYNIYDDADDVFYKSRAAWGFVASRVASLHLYTPDEFLGLPPDFKRKLMLAQVFEADARLNPDPLSDPRLDGLISQKVGESTTTFQNTKGAPLRLKLRRGTYQIMAPYVSWAPRLSRM